MATLRRECYHTLCFVLFYLLTSKCFSLYFCYAITILVAYQWHIFSIMYTVCVANTCIRLTMPQMKLEKHYT